MAYGNFENWSRKAASDKLLHDEKFNIDKNPNNVGYQQGFATMIYKCFNKKVSGGDAKWNYAKTNNLLHIYTSQFKNVKNAKYIHLLKTALSLGAEGR